MVLQVAGAAAQPAQAGIAAELHKVGAQETVCATRDLVEECLCVVGERHLTGVNLQDLAPAGDVGRADEYFTVEAARPAESWIDGVDSVSGADHNHRIDALEAVHQGE